MAEGVPAADPVLDHGVFLGGIFWEVEVKRTSAVRAFWAGNWWE